MLKFKHATLIALSGAVWFAVGLYLLPLGIGFLMKSAEQSARFAGQAPLLENLSFLPVEQVALLVLAVALGVGYVKSKYVFAKAVQKGVARIRSLPTPAPFYSIYTPRYLILLGAMVLLGISLKYVGLPLDIRGFVDVAIGAALINGSVLYFKEAAASPASAK